MAVNEYRPARPELTVGEPYGSLAGGGQIDEGSLMGIIKALLEMGKEPETGIRMDPPLQSIGPRAPAGPTSPTSVQELMQMLGAEG